MAESTDTLVVGADADHVAALRAARVGGTDDVRFAVVGQSLIGYRFRRAFLCSPPPPDDDVSPRAQAMRAWLDRLQLTLPPDVLPVTLWRAW